MNEPFRGADGEIDARARRIDLAHEPDFAIGPVAVRPSLRTIAGPLAEAMLEPKVMQVMVALGTSGGAILSRDDLIERCWEGRVVGDTSINRVISLLRSGLKEVCGEAVTLENVPKVGYRLVANEDIGSEAERDRLPSPKRIKAMRRKGLSAIGIGAGVIALIVAAISLFALQPSSEAPVSKIKVAMLPISVDEGVDPLYARGLEAELRAQFARVGRMEVTNSETARQLFEQGLTAEEICERLGADYAWVGRISVASERVSLRTRIIQASNKQTVFREELTAAPDAAQYLPLRTARAVSTALGRPVSGRLPESDVSAGDYRLYLTAVGLIKGRGVEQRRAAYDILTSVTQRNPNFADGWAGLAKSWYLLPWDEIAEKDANRAQALVTARRALEIDPDAIDALKVAGMLSEDPVERLELLGRATSLDPGDAEAWFWLGITQREHILIAEEPLQSALQMVAIDPLWPASWRASDMAAEFGDLGLAREVEASIQSAAATPSQRLLSEARQARLEGDLSGYLSLAGQAAPTSTAAQRRFSTMAQTHMVRLLLDLPVDRTDLGMMGDLGPAELLERVLIGDLPAFAEFAANGVAGEGFWQADKLVIAALPLFLEEGRQRELVRHFDDGFGSPDALLTFARSTNEEHFLVPIIATYVGAAMQAEGRDGDAAALFELAEEQIARWRNADTGWIIAVIYEIDLATAKGELDRAARLVEQLPTYGWPYTMGHIEASVVGLLRSNPLHNQLRERPDVRAILDPIRSRLATEREEVLAGG